MWKKYEKTKNKIKITKEKWYNRKQIFEDKMSAKYDTIDRLLRETEQIKERNEVEIQERM